MIGRMKLFHRAAPLALAASLALAPAACRLPARLAELAGTGQSAAREPSAPVSAAPPRSAPAKATELLRVEDVAARPLPGTSLPGSLRFSPDGALVTYIFAAEEALGQQLYGFDPKTVQTRRLAFPPGIDDATEAGAAPPDAERPRARPPEVSRYTWSDANNRLLIPIGNDLYVQDSLGSPMRLALKFTGEPFADPQLSPDGQHIAYVQNDEVMVVSLAGGSPRALTSGARASGKAHGVPELMARMEMGRQRGFWWSRDSRSIAFTEVDETVVPKYRIMHAGKDQVGEQAQEDQPFPFAGEKNAVVRLGVVPAAGGKPVWMDLGGAEYLARVDWLTDGRLAAQLENREQSQLDLVFFDPGSGRGRKILSEKATSWINLNNLFRPLEGGGFLWASERSGFQHLYLYDARGQLVRPLTSGEWMVTAVLDVDTRGRKAYFIGTREDPRERHLYEVSLDGGEPRRITRETGTHTATIDPGFQRFIDVRSSIEQAPRVTLRSLADDSELALLHEQRDPRVERFGLKPPRLVTLRSRDGATLYGAIYEPDGPGPHPTLVDVYGGPQLQTVTNSWNLTVNLRAQLLRSRGYLVFRLDNRGSANRGVEFERRIRRDMGNIEVQDQVDGVNWLASQGLSDPRRVGIYGWSYGGYMSAISLVRAPDVFKLGIAGAPVTHWDGYDTHYTEQYMGTPQDNPEGYKVSSVMHHVDKLKGKLMLVHGLMDDNVHFRHSARLVNALIGARKEYELVVLPDSRHGPRGYADRVYLEQRVLDFISRNL
jgi:dipeptidyl-peptidase-4